MLTEVVERTMSHTNSNEVLIVGGVGCNKRLQKIINKMLEQRKGKVGKMDQRYCIDNGAMIGYTGYLMYKQGTRCEMKDTYFT